ncbi:MULTISPECIES: hypothetical protein [unclassified Haloferax]|uniref:hypothetical protein n=1 Tax=unclassified Haloferax TaxID=2625095 RepID=UPI00287451A5|nr:MULTISPECIES: hypothetical protein [unclassified Haloferax]MDS0243745.1 hypothetical protein [Haloferax sp. S2CR25]MDS0446866.1 hypothetical protein [Haloferax sp. S2CR25-2]
MSHRDTPRRILDEFGTSDEIFGIEIDYSLNDLKLFFPAGVVCGFILLATPQWLNIGGLLATIGILLLTVGFIFVTPSHKSPQQWLADMIMFSRAEHTKTAVAETPAKQTDSLTQVKRFLPISNLVERTDGHLVAALRVSPANLSLATDREWEAMANSFGSVLNALDFDFQIHSTARPVEPDRITAGYRERLDDSDVVANPALGDIIRVYRERFPAEFESRGTCVREYHILIPVSIREVQLADRGALAKLCEVPVIGGFIRVFGAESTQLTHEEIHERQKEELGRRLRTLESGIRDLEGCDAERVSADELSALLEEYWSGERTHYGPSAGQRNERVRSIPVVTGDDSGRF